MSGNQTLQQVIEEMTEIVKPIVETIENNTVPTTKDRYGDYLSVLTSQGDNDSKKMIILAYAMLKAGANRRGIAYAYSIATGIPMSEVLGE